MLLTVGQTLGNRYRIDALLGQGGMGAVYRAFDLRLNTLCAAKEMIPPPGLSAAEMNQLRLQFRQEASVLAHLSHPNLPRVIDYFSWGSGEILVMDFAQGESLESLMQQVGALDEAQVVAWTDQLLDALAYIHARSIIHRDIKPANIIITPEGRAVLVDFGLVKVWNPADPRTMTLMRGMGTPAYAPPEQYGLTASHTDARSDLYSLGATLYHALTGEEPPLATQRMAKPAIFVPPRTRRPALSPATDSAVVESMNMDMDHRFQTAGEMRAAFHATIVTPPPVPRPRRQLRWWAAAGALALLLVCGTLLWRACRGEDGIPTTVVVVPPTAVPALITRPPSPTSAPVTSTATELPTATLPPMPTQAPPPTIAVPTVAVVAPVDWIAFVSERQGNQQIYLMRPDGKEVHRITSQGENSGPAWSFDGEWLAFTSTRDRNNEIYIMRPDGTGLHNVTNSPSSDDDDSTWSPDGKWLAFSSNLSGAEQIYKIRVEGSDWIRVARSSGRDTMPDWSVRGQIAFRSNQTGKNQVWIVNDDGSNPYNVTNDDRNNQSPNWSPDGSRIVYKSKDGSTFDLFVVNADGGGKKALTNEFVYLWSADWSPNGKSLVFAMETDCPPNAMEACNREIYTMPAAGGEMTRLTFEAANDWDVAWSPR